MEMTYCHGCDSTNPPTNCDPGLQQKEDQKVLTPIKLTKEEHIALTIQGPQKVLIPTKLTVG